jgi:NHL repeat
MRKAVFCAILFTLGICLAGALPAAAAGNLNLRLQLPQNTAQYIYYTMTPYGVAVDGQGNVYVADTANNRIVSRS